MHCTYIVTTCMHVHEIHNDIQLVKLEIYDVILNHRVR